MRTCGRARRSLYRVFSDFKRSMTSTAPQRAFPLLSSWSSRPVQRSITRIPVILRTPSKMPAPTLENRLLGAIAALPDIDSPDFGVRFDSFGQQYDVVLIGDGSHGTSEFYAARAEITKHLITHHGFTVVATEADWPDADAVDRYARPRPDIPQPQPDPEAPRKDGQPADTTKPFARFPTWMWRNLEVQEFVHWLKDYNATVPDDRTDQRVGFYGLDLYSMRASIDAVLQYLDGVDPRMAALARRRYAELDRWADDPSAYGLASVSDPEFVSCEPAVLNMLRALLEKRLQYAGDGDAFHSAEQNARLVADAERYYRALFRSDASSWNLRDAHMFGTLARVRAHRAGAKTIVWAHNSHVGDARFTSMGARRGELNVGQLCREAWGARVGIVGTHIGAVAAAHEWDDDMQIMHVRPSRPDSVEGLMHRVSAAAALPRFVLDLCAVRKDEELARELEKERLMRFIGVIYRPDTERHSHYSHVCLPKQMDAFVWFDETRGVRALEKNQPKLNAGLEETYPFGV